jgi:hypothetical protein
LSAKLVRTFADRGFHVVSVKDSYGRTLGFLDRKAIIIIIIIIIIIVIIIIIIIIIIMFEKESR